MYEVCAWLPADDDEIYMSEDEESYSDFNPIEDDPERKKYNEVLSDSDAESLDERYNEFDDVSDASNESRAFVRRKKSRAPHLEIRQLRHSKDTHKTRQISDERFEKNESSDESEEDSPHDTKEKEGTHPVTKKRSVP